jgi:hypothetical protein
MTEQKKFRMDEAGQRLVRIIEELRALQEQLHNKKLGVIIEDLASAATAALGWEWLAEANGFSHVDIRVIPAGPVTEDTEIVWINGVAFVNARKHEEVVKRLSGEDMP